MTNPAMETTNRPLNLGQSLDDQAVRLDAVEKVTGRAKFSRDQYLPNSIFAEFIRCPFGKGELESENTDAAQAVAGVVEVEITARAGTYQGQPVGHIAADSKTALRRAMRALDAQWRRLDSTTTLGDTIEEPTPPDEEHQRLLDGAPHTLVAQYATPVQTHCPLETHGGVVDHRGERAVAYISTQGTQAAADGLDDALELPRAKIEVNCEYIGGGFGSKLNGAGKEGALAARLSAKHRRPAYVFTDRHDDHLDTGNRPSSISRVKVAYDETGAILGGHIHTWGAVGVGSRGGGVTIPSGHYDLGDLQKTHIDIPLNTGAPRPFRAPGRPQGVFVEELMLDEVAAAVGRDPLALRLELAASRDHRRMLERGADLIGWGQRRPNGTGKTHKKRGFGCGLASWGRFPANAAAEVVVYRDGSVEVRTGTQDIGTGMRTVAGVLTAHHLGVPLERISVQIGRSNLPPGPASGGSMTSHNTSPAIVEAAQNARAKILELVGAVVGADASKLDIAGGNILRGDATVMSFEDACLLIPGESTTGTGRWKGRRGDPDKIGKGHERGAQFVEVEVDTETGVIRVRRVIAIQSCGLVICRKTAESQIIGAVIQGLSYALFEDKIMDRFTGSMVNPNLEQYKILGTFDTPHIEPVLWLDGQTGVRSLGEPPTIPTAGATACAVFNAIGSPVRSLPMTPDRVLEAMEGAPS